MISRTVKVKIFCYFEILNFRSDDVTFLRNVETAIFNKKRVKKHNNISCADENNFIEIEEIEIEEDDNELQRTFRVATIVLLQ